MVVVAVLITAFMLIGMRARSVVPGRLQGSVEFFHDYVHGLIAENIGPAGRKYFPFVFTIFIFILFLNLVGLVPSSPTTLIFTATSHIIVTFAMALVVFLLRPRSVSRSMASTSSPSSCRRACRPGCCR